MTNVENRIIFVLLSSKLAGTIGPSTYCSLKASFASIIFMAT